MLYTLGPPPPIAPDTDHSGCCAAAEQVKDRPPAPAEESIDTNILDFCSIDSQGRRLMSPKTLGEKEQDYLDALRVWPSVSTQESGTLLRARRLESLGEHPVCVTWGSACHGDTYIHHAERLSAK